MIKVKDLAFLYDGRPILESISFSLPKGKVGCIIGQSGCGKTTLLRCLAGFESCSGSISFFSKEVSNVSVKDRGVGFVFQQPCLISSLSVRDNILIGCSKSYSKHRFLDRVSILKLDDCLDRYPHEISGGQQQRVSLARSLMLSPKFLLLDEPFSNLDPEYTVSLWTSIDYLLKQQDITALFVTHSMPEAYQFSDYLGVMNQGKLEDWGHPKELYYTPKTLYTANYIGEGTSVFAKVSKSTVRILDSVFPIKNPESVVIFDDKVFLRPHQISLTDNDNALLAIVKAHDFLGELSRYDLELDDGTMLVMSSLVLLPIQMGDKVKIKINF